MLPQDFGPASNAREVHVPIDSNDSKNHRYLLSVESIEVLNLYRVLAAWHAVPQLPPLHTLAVI